MIASFVVSLYLFDVPGRMLAAIGLGGLPRPAAVVEPGPLADAWIMIYTVLLSTIVWVAVTYLTRPESTSILERFYLRVRPGGPGWVAISQRLGYGREPMPGGVLAWTNWVAGVVAVYGTLFGIGKLLFGEWAAAALFLGVAVLAFAWISRSLRQDPPGPQPIPIEAAPVAAD